MRGGQVPTKILKVTTTYSKSENVLALMAFFINILNKIKFTRNLGLMYSDLNLTELTPKSFKKSTRSRILEDPLARQGGSELSNSNFAVSFNVRIREKKFNCYF